MQFKAIYQGQRHNGRSRSEAAKFVLDASDPKWQRWDQDKKNKTIAYIIYMFERG